MDILHNEKKSEKCIKIPIWSRLRPRNSDGYNRSLPIAKNKSYDIELKGKLFSLWGSLHPDAPVFDKLRRGRQYLACNIMSLCAARAYPLEYWNSKLLDSVVVNGDRYHYDSFKHIMRNNFEFSLEDLNTEAVLEKLKFDIDIQYVCYGQLYSIPKPNKMNLCTALNYFFSKFRYGILQIGKRSLAFGKSDNGEYFLFDSQSKSKPLFKDSQGAAYILRTPSLDILQYCLVSTLNCRSHNTDFHMHRVEIENKL